MKTLILNNHTKDLLELERLFTDAFVVTKEVFDQGFSVDGYDLLVISGATNMPMVLRQPDFYTHEMEIIKNSAIPIIGICLGCELINCAFGGDLKELDKDHMGEVVIKILDNGLKVKIGAESLTTYEHHRVGVNKLAEYFTIEALSDHGPEIITHQTKPIIGIQFHPEVEYQQNVIDWAMSKLGLK